MRAQKDTIKAIAIKVQNGAPHPGTDEWGKILDYWDGLAQSGSPIGRAECLPVAAALDMSWRYGKYIQDDIEGLIRSLEEAKHPQANDLDVKAQIYLLLDTFSNQNPIVTVIGNVVSLYLERSPGKDTLSLTKLATREGLTLGDVESKAWVAVSETLGSKKLTWGEFGAWFKKACETYCTVDGPQDELQALLDKSKLAVPDNKEFGGTLEKSGKSYQEVLKVMAEFWEAYSIEDSYSREMLTRWLAGIPTLTFEPGAPMQWALVLQGRGGCGKTALGQILSPLKAAPPPVLDPSTLRNPRAILEAAEGSAIVTLDELDTYSSKHDMASLKSFLSSSSFNLRKPYQKSASEIKRSWVALATMNASQLPHDDGAENRRLVCVAIPGSLAEGQARAQWLLENRERILAAATALYRSGYPIDLDPDLWYANKDAQSEFAAPDEAVDRFVGKLEALEAYVQPQPGTIVRVTPQILAQATGTRVSTRSTNALRDFLESNGWTYRKTPSKLTPKTRVMLLLPPGVDFDSVETITYPTTNDLNILKRLI